MTVATGRVGLFGFAKNRTTSLAQVAQPIDVLFRRKYAPAHARDVYAVDRTDEAVIGGTLPDSDLVKSVHGYVSGFYGGRLGCGRGDIDGAGDNVSINGSRKRANSAWYSMDETALLAVGVLLEEACDDIVDEIGYRAFAERLEEAEVGTESLQAGSKRKFEELD